MNLIVKASRKIYKPLSRVSIRPMYLFSSSTNVDFDKLASSFSKEPDMTIFSDLVRASNNTVDNINYFRIFKFL